MTNRIEFTKQMRRDYQILVPDMAPIHFKILQSVFRSHKYNLVLLENEGQPVVDAGLRWVHNDTCYPALLVVGQFMDAITSGKYDLSKTALMITQTGGGCRASNYIHLLRKTLKKAGYGHIPVISLNFTGLESNSGFKLTFPLLRKTLAGLAFGDLLMSLKNQIKAYEINKGEADSLTEKWIGQISRHFADKKSVSMSSMKNIMAEIAAEYDNIPIRKEKRLRVGIVGEIYVKFSPLGNNHLEDFLHKEGCEVCVPGILGFVFYCADNMLTDGRLYGTGAIRKFVLSALMKYLYGFEEVINHALRDRKNVKPLSDYRHSKKLSAKVIGEGCKMGEGWLLPAEMLDLIENGFENIVCAQPFGCLPNHIVGKGVIRGIRAMYKNANIVPVDYDPGATRVNQENRIKLMLAMAAHNDI